MVDHIERAMHHPLGRRQLMPHRVQRRRTKGWRMQANTVYFGRGSEWGNPWRGGPQVGPSSRAA